MKTKVSLLAILLIVVAVISCKKYELTQNPGNEDYSATPVLPETPDNYASSTNDHLAALGRVLFYDKNLSLNNTVACASCHQQSKAFCDNLQFSVGLEDTKTPRNSPSIFAKAGRMFWDGRASSLQDLVLRPIKNHVEMKFENLDALAKKISKIDYYQPLFFNAFKNSEVDSIKIRSALAEFIRNFNFSNNKFNRSIHNGEALNASESLGKMLFFGKAKCSGCHHLESESAFGNTLSGGYGFTNQDFNIGLETNYADNGMGNVTRNTSDNGKFMVPVLLNVEYTAPYMHDGRFKTLEEVVEHYNSGIRNHPNLDIELRDTKALENLTEEELFEKLDLNHNQIIDPSEMQLIPPVKLNLSQSEKRNLVDFLKTLSDPSILVEAKFKNPFTSK